MLTWLHLSDLQLKAGGKPWVLDTLLDDLSSFIETKKPQLDLDGVTEEKKPQLDFVFVTGDVSHSGQPEEYDRASRFFNRLQDSTSIPKERLFFIPGNHDIDRKRIESHYESLEKTVSQTSDAPLDAPPWAIGLEAYDKFVSQFHGPHPESEKNRFYVRHLVVGGKRIALLGLNTAWMGNVRPYLPYDRLGVVIPSFRDQVAIALDQARNADLKIALTHHSLDYIDGVLRGNDSSGAGQSDEAVQRLREECDFVLHSHLMGEVQPPHRVSPGLIIIDGGSNPGDGPHPDGYNLANVDFDQNAVSIRMRGFTGDPQAPWAASMAAATEGVLTLGLPPWRPRFTGFATDTAEGEDQLNITPDVNAFSAVFASNQVVPPLCLGLFGDWGAGKTFFMDKMWDRIERLKDLAQAAEIAERPSSYCAHIVQIRFNAWHYIDANLWASLAHHIFRELAAAISGDRSGKEKEEKAELLRKLEAARKLRDDADLRLKDTKRKLATAKQQLREARAIREGRELELGDLAAVAWQEVIGNAEVQKELSETSQQIGLPVTIQNAEELNNTLQGLRTFWGKFKLSFRTPSQRRLWLRALLVMVLVIAASAFILNWILNNPTLIGAMATVLGVVSAGLAVIKPLLKPIWNFAQTLQGLKTELDKRLQEKRETLTQAEADLQKELSDLRKQEAEMQQALAKAQKEVDVAQGALEEEHEQRLDDFIRKRVASREYEKQLGIVSLVHTDFKTLSELLGEGDDPALPRIDRIILYIDDLDRCPEEKVTDVLQAVHLLLAFELFIVVVGVDSRWLLRSLERSYPALQQAALQQAGLSADEMRAWESTPQNYLEKIFQIPFNLQRLDQPGVRRLADSILGATAQRVARSVDQQQPRGRDEDDNGPSRVQEEQTGEAPPERETESIDLTPPALNIEAWEREFIPMLSMMLPTPRAVKRFVNIYRLIRARVPPRTLYEFVGTEENPGEFVAVMILLAILTGFPRLAARVFGMVLRLGKSSPWSYVVDALAPELISGPLPRRFRNEVVPDMEAAEAAEWGRLYTALSSLAEQGKQLHTMEPYSQWVHQVARFSFRAGKTADGF